MRWILAFVLMIAPLLACAKPIQLTPNNVVMLQDEIDAAHMDTFLTAVTAKRAMLPVAEPLYIVIFSPGGDVEIAKVMSEYLNQVPNLRLICLSCASAAGWIFEKSNKPRLVVPRSTIMMHEIRIMIVTPSLMRRIDPDDLARDGAEFNQIFAIRMSITPEAYLAKIQDTDWSVKADEMLKLKLADEKVTVQCAPFVRMMMPRTCMNAAD